MGKILKKGKQGNVTKYIARSKAVRKLQISLAQFRRLCILKGIYPVEPKNKTKLTKSTALKTWYYRKDIQFLAHEPILQTLREEKIYDRKLGKALGKQEWAVAKLLNEEKPVYTLDHVVRERYPTFIDALRDLDDALSMITLFATLPANDKISTHHVVECTRLIAEFQTYIIKSGSLRKSFLSIKGIYYQTVIYGQTITWIAPYRFAQTVPTDVDFRVMATFLEIYETLLAFVNFKLFSDMGLSYPPTATDSDVEVKEVEMDMDSVPKPVVAPTTDTETVPQLSAPTRVFAGFKFALSREVPQEALTFVIQSMGGKIVSETQATHVVSDRPGAAVEGCEVIQPQWVFDCLNANKVVKTDGYHPGETLPPHLSPFVSAGEDDYVPAGAEVEAETVETEAAEEKEKMSEDDKELAKIMMSKRDLKLYNKMQHGKQRKVEKAQTLRAKKAAIDGKK